MTCVVGCNSVRVLALLGLQQGPLRCDASVFLSDFLEEVLMAVPSLLHRQRVLGQVGGLHVEALAVGVVDDLLHLEARVHVPATRQRCDLPV